MTANLWWQERLETKQPIRDVKTRVEGFNVKYSVERPGPWPKAVARQALWLDYQIWFDEVFLPSYRNSQFYIDDSTRLPKMLSEMQFFIIIGPWVYPEGKDKAVKNYFVKESRFFEGQWIQVRVRRYFIRLKSWEEHVAVFETQVQQIVRRPKERLTLT